jgi:two-component system, OmpR family, KDP operon response regulator KdpE
VLVVEDDPSMAEIVATALRARGHEVDIATTGEEALSKVSLNEVDVVILDLGLPDIDGGEVCVRLRRWFRNPILVLSADGDDDRKVSALEGGADDYVTKPFSMPELLARLGVALRHRAAVASALDPVAITVGDLRLDESAHAVTIDGAPLQLARKEFALLAALARNPGRVLTHHWLLERVWGTNDPAKTETLRVHVNQLRRKLGAGPRRPKVLTEPGVGYRLVRPDDE